MKKHEFKIGDAVVCHHFHNPDNTPDTVLEVDNVKIVVKRSNGDVYHAHKSILEHYHE